MQAILKVLLRILLMTKLKSYRRVIGIAGMGGALVIQKVLCDPNVVFDVQGLAHACSGGLATLLVWLQTIGAYAGTVGVLDRNEKLTKVAGVGTTGDMLRPGA